jgi:multiple sugar transport system permease protein
MMKFPSAKKMTLIAGAVVAINGFFPALWILFTSLKTESELMRLPITIWPAAPTLGNYTRVFVDQPIFLFMWNSFVVAVLSTMQFPAPADGKNVPIEFPFNLKAIH